ncbi:restriction endonuclease subunit S [Campylobacter jejuni]|nr:restriction endonuclease subunit S [Campylobacter coli]EAJ0218581.1 restriction endonuclease subunit S [Campylobacter jejuni]EAJ0699710.1 restriction endonuclease subunit S [Campylobacter jejuni]EAK3744007.1 restriction endonuclease subunit S [Campylobacter jejuni]EAL1455325.1 restriction endonuclease subunit S [Campylobacter coli]
MKNFKDSGIEWLGEIPQDWKVKRLRYIGYVFGGLVGKTSKDFSDEYIKGFKPYITFKNVCDNTIINFNKIEYVNINDLEKQNKVIKNDILFLQSSETLDEIGKSAIYLNDEEIYLNTFCKGFRIKNSAFPIFLNYLFNSLTYKKYFISNCSGFTRINLRQEHLLDIPLILPPLKEQEQIANFLDEKCEKIKNFIEKKEKLISLLKEQKQALINETITKGLDKNINFKDSGIEWLGEIPQHWEVKKLKMLFTLGNGLNITKADFVSYGIPCVSYGEIHSKYPCRLNTTIHALPFVSKTYLADKPQSLLQKGDFVFADTSEDIEGSGNFTSIQSDTPIFAGYHTIILKYKGKINSLYFSFLFDSIFTRNQIRKEVCGVKVFSITKSILKEVQCLIPPLKEQEQIANFLDEKCEKIDLLIEKTKKQIKLIKEYKTTLINQAVCGRISL